MLNPLVIGTYLSRLRKEKNYTQAALADHVGVSPQAVSKWERGDSLPDIGSLLSLSETFEVSVDAILYGGKPPYYNPSIEALLREVNVGKAKEAATYIKDGSLPLESLVELGPLMDTADMESLVKDLAPHDFTLDHLLDLAPFVHGAVLKKLFLSISTEEITSHHLKSLAPFIEGDLLEGQLERLGHTLTYDELASIAPFLSAGTLYESYMSIEGKASSTVILSLAPFLGASLLSKLLKETPPEDIDFNFLTEIAPFAEDFLNEQLATNPALVLSWSGLARVAPFLEEENLALLLENESLQEPGEEDLVSLAPFVGKARFSRLLQRYQGKLSPGMIAGMAPFIDQELLTKLIERA